MSLEANRNSLPPGHLTKLLKEAGLKKVDLEEGRNIDGQITINKRTLLKLDKGLQVQRTAWPPSLWIPESDVPSRHIEQPRQGIHS